MTVEELVQGCFGVALERSDYDLERYDQHGALAHVGVTGREVEFVGAGERVPVFGIRFVCTRQDGRHRGVASDLMRLAHALGREWKVPFAVLYSGIAPFYEQLGYRQVGVSINGAAWCLELGAKRWPQGTWRPVGSEW